MQAHRSLARITTYNKSDNVHVNQVINLLKSTDDKDINNKIELINYNHFIDIRNICDDNNFQRIDFCSVLENLLCNIICRATNVDTITREFTAFGIREKT